MVQMRFTRAAVRYRMTFHETKIIVRKGRMVDINIHNNIILLY
jgi:hypothetical protein